jgi:secondary thiamine-phosphate synthase enzyme
MTVLELRSTARREMVDVTELVMRCVRESGVGEGLCHVYVPHTTAAVVINENADPDVPRDLVAAYAELIPKIRFHHAEGNSDAHLLATLLGSSVTVPVSGGRMQLGTWQGIFFVELDGPRQRRALVTVG